VHRPGSNPLDMQMSDFLCDFCMKSWSESTPFVEGHHGSCICGDCLRAAAKTRGATMPSEHSDERSFNASEAGPARPGASAMSKPASAADMAVERSCTMCLEARAEHGWQSEKRAAWICDRCIDQASRVLSKHRSAGWSPADDS